MMKPKLRDLVPILHACHLFILANHRYSHSARHADPKNIVGPFNPHCTRSLALRGWLDLTFSSEKFVVRRLLPVCFLHGRHGISIPAKLSLAGCMLVRAQGGPAKPPLRRKTTNRLVGNGNDPSDPSEVAHNTTKLKRKSMLSCCKMCFL